MINWIDESLAVSDFEAGSFENRNNLPKGRYIITDVRCHFTQIYKHLIDDTMPKDSLLDFVEELIDLMSRGWKVIIHCYGGIDRAPFTAVLYLTRKYSCSLDDAYKMVKSKRPETIEHPEWIQWAREKGIETTWGEVLCRGH